MNTHVAVPPTVGRAPAKNPPPRRPLVTFAAVALPVGWVLLSVPLVVDVPLEPFVLATLLPRPRRYRLSCSPAGTAASVKAPVPGLIRLPRPLWLLVPAALLIPVAVGAAGALAGGGPAITGRSSPASRWPTCCPACSIVNLWEEMAWAGLRAAAGDRPAGASLAGGVVTALLFTGIHLPLDLLRCRRLR